VQDYIEKKCKNKITVDELSDKFGIGRRTFERRFKKATSNTVAPYQCTFITDSSTYCNTLAALVSGLPGGLI